MIGSEKSNNKRESVLAILDATKQGDPSNPSKLLHILFEMWGLQGIKSTVRVKNF